MTDVRPLATADSEVSRRRGTPPAWRRRDAFMTAALLLQTAAPQRWSRA